MARRTIDDWIHQMDAQIQRLSTETIASGPKIARHRGWVPRVDIVETDSHLIVRVELAGVQASQVHLNYNPARNALVVRGERQDALVAELSCLGAHQLEIEFGEFQREIELPEMRLDLQRVRHQLSEGLLVIAVPKIEDGMSQTVVEHTISITKLS